MRRTGRLLVVVSLIGGLMAAAGPVQADEVEEIGYVITGTITVEGQSPGFPVLCDPDPSAFGWCGDFEFDESRSIGDPIAIRYVVDPDTGDTFEADETRGLYEGALQHLEIEVAGDPLVSSGQPGINSVAVGNNLEGFGDGYQIASTTAELDILVVDGDGSTLMSDLLVQPIGDLQALIANHGSDSGMFSITVGEWDGVSDFIETHTEIYRFDVSWIQLDIPDSDGDGVLDDADNCPDVVNPDQANFDSDGLGDACDPNDDNDGVLDGDDVCAETLIPDPVIPTSGELGVNRYALTDGDTTFDTNTAQNDGAIYTLDRTRGCSATQIADALGLGKSHYEKGITRSVLESWIAGLNG